MASTELVACSWSRSPLTLGFSVRPKLRKVLSSSSASSELDASASLEKSSSLPVAHLVGVGVGVRVGVRFGVIGLG